MHPNYLKMNLYEHSNMILITFHWYWFTEAGESCSNFCVTFKSFPFS
jgi:hypothetical protein